jgi:hypothetical protein
MSTHGLESASQNFVLPVGPYSQVLTGKLPPIGHDTIHRHLLSSGKRIANTTDVSQDTLRRGWQFFREGYLPGRYIRLCVQNEVVFITGQCYHSMKKIKQCSKFNLLLVLPTLTMWRELTVLALPANQEFAITWLDFYFSSVITVYETYVICLKT